MRPNVLIVRKDAPTVVEKDYVSGPPRSSVINRVLARGVRNVRNVRNVTVRNV